MPETKKYIIFLLSLTLSMGVKSQVRLSSEGSGDEITVKCYPNPATTVVTLDFQKFLDKNSVIQVFNFLGKKVFEASVTEERLQINVSELFRGIYIFQLKDPSGRILATGKFQVSK